MFAKIQFIHKIEKYPITKSIEGLRRIGAGVLRRPFVDFILQKLPSAFSQMFCQGRRLRPCGNRKTQKVEPNGGFYTKNLLPLHREAING